MPPDYRSTAPRPFVFVLMPFDSKFNDIYRYGIRGAAEDAGAYAERLDDQIFAEGMLDRIFNQISRADVVVADMTGRNPNVFYEVGYAHALDKIVILLTQDASDIPFDLKHRQHIVYDGSIEKLRSQLAPFVAWAIGEAKRNIGPAKAEILSVRIASLELPKVGTGGAVPTLHAKSAEKSFSLRFTVRNRGPDTTQPITHIYLFAKADSTIVPMERNHLPTTTPQLSSVGNWGMGGYQLIGWNPSTPISPIATGIEESLEELSTQYRLPCTLPSMPPMALEQISVDLSINSTLVDAQADFMLRFVSPFGVHDFPFRLDIHVTEAQEPTESQDES